jgi:hypothetical protein
MILILEMKAKHYESFRAEVNSVLDLSLPKGPTLWQSYGHVSGFIGFATGSTPSVLSPGVSMFRTDYYKPYR